MKRSRIIRRILYVVLGLTVFIILLAILIPFLFKDQIKEQINQAVAQSVDAQVDLNLDDLGISLLRNFPNITASLHEVSVAGNEPFVGDTLVSFKTGRVTIDIWSVIFGDKIKVRSIYVKQPRVYAKVLANGKANWDIAISNPEDTTQTEDTSATTSTEFNIGIRRWTIEDGYVVYDDASLNTFLQIEKLNHTGRGDLNQENFDLITSSTLENVRLDYEGIAYLEDELLDADVTVNMNIPNNKYTFKKNSVKVNDFSVGFEGFVQLAEEDINMDISFAAQENRFKNLLSLVPGVFTQDFEQITSDGKLVFDGGVKGTYNASQMPAFFLNAQVSEGMFQYPDLPTAINNINLDLKVDNKDGVIDNTIINLAKFHMDLGTNPVDAKAYIEGISQSKIDAQASAKLNLADLIKMFPMPGLDLKGNFSFNAKAKGTYNDKLQTLPAIDVQMLLKQGYVKSNQYPDALENVRFLTEVKNQSGRYEDTRIEIKNFNMILDKEPFEAEALINDLKDIHYRVKVKGGIDLEKATHVYPIEGMQVAGKVYADIVTEGKMSDVLAERYDLLPTSGYGQVRNLSYTSVDLPQGLKITEAHASFSPQVIDLDKFNGFLGKSDIQLTGKLRNYISYLFAPNGVIVGNMNFFSNTFDLNEWMEESITPTQTKTPETTNTSEPSPNTSEETLNIEIPKNIDFTLDAKINKVDYELLPLSKLAGIITIKDGIIRLQSGSFQALGGEFIANGSFDPREAQKPRYDFDFGISNLPLSNAYQTFIASSIDDQFAKNLTGKFKSKVKISGLLDANLMPVLDESLNGLLSASVTRATVKNASVLKELSTFTKLGNLNELSLEDVFVVGKIKNGRMAYEPFNVKVGDYRMNVRGSNGLQGDLDFLLKLDVPLNSIGPIARTTLGIITGQDVRNGVKNLILNFKVAGDYNKPKINLLSTDEEKTVRQRIEEEIEDKVEETVEEIIEDKTGKSTEELAEEIMSNARTNAENVRKEAYAQAQSVREEADAQEKKALEEASKKGLVAKKAAEIAARKVKKVAYDKADKIEQEGDRKAEQILEEAQKQVDALK